MKLPFRKMHGIGNDFVVLDARGRADLRLTPAHAAALADRHTGVGCDQVIVLEPVAAGEGADVFMRIRNPDGSEAGA
ncbi:MAG: diaminopimelate epimerase, partial [Acetobacteraceae bacterium]|nr:diaminopimelate epimerase [Acetobacteraceae bacterium]